MARPLIGGVVLLALIGYTQEILRSAIVFLLILALPVPTYADKLRKILQGHVTTSAVSAASLQDGQVVSMVSGLKATVRRDGDAVYVNDARILSSTPAENGMLHVIDAVLLPPAAEAPAGG